MLRPRARIPIAAAAAVLCFLAATAGAGVSEREPRGEAQGAGKRPVPGTPVPGGPEMRPAPGGGKRAASAGPVVAVVPLVGQVGGLVNRQVDGTFDAELVKACFAEAQRRGAELVLLDVSSPGGLVAEMEAICETIVEWKDRLRIAAFTGDAFSAAAIIALTCPEMVVRPDSRIGAAVIVREGSGGMTAVEAKMASVHHAKQRQFMEASGQPYDVVAAMTIQDTTLWWSPQGGFATAPPAAGEGAGWREVDGRTTVLTMTARQALEWGVADASAPAAAEAAAALGVEGEVVVVGLDDVAKHYNAVLDRKLADLHDGLENYFEGLGGMVAGMNDFVAAVKQGDRRNAGLAKSQINRSRGKVQASARRIREADRSMLSRRVVVGDRVLERLEEDAALLGRISGLMSTDTVDDFNEASVRLNEVLAQWRAMMAGGD